PPCVGTQEQGFRCHRHRKNEHAVRSPTHAPSSLTSLRVGIGNWLARPLKQCVIVEIAFLEQSAVKNLLVTSSEFTHVSSRATQNLTRDSVPVEFRTVRFAFPACTVIVHPGTHTVTTVWVSVSPFLTVTRFVPFRYVTVILLIVRDRARHPHPRNVSDL